VSRAVSGRRAFFEIVGRGTAKTSRELSQELAVDCRFPTLERVARVRKVLRAAGETLHGYEVLAADESQTDPAKRYRDATAEGSRTEAAQADEQIDAVAELVANSEDRRDRIIRIATIQFRPKPGLPEVLLQRRKLHRGARDQGIGVRRRAHSAVACGWRPAWLKAVTSRLCSSCASSRCSGVSVPALCINASRARSETLERVRIEGAVADPAARAIWSATSLRSAWMVMVSRLGIDFLTAICNYLFAKLIRY
jgi:hypothetical protein